jgi:hypothetical protein
MKTGITTRDIEYSNAACRTKGIVKAGTEVFWSQRGNLWAVRYPKDAPFMLPWDFVHHYVTVPADAVQTMEEK